MEAGVCLPLNMKYYEFLSIYQYLNTNVAKSVRSEAKHKWLAGLAGLAGLPAEEHHQRAEVIRCSSTPQAVSVPFTRLDSTKMGRGWMLPHYGGGGSILAGILEPEGVKTYFMAQNRGNYPC